jgi:hypothetical protein
MYYDLGHMEPLLVKFADGGNRKRAQYPGRQWVDRQQLEVTFFGSQLPEKKPR